MTDKEALRDMEKAIEQLQALPHCGPENRLLHRLHQEETNEGRPKLP